MQGKIWLAAFLFFHSLLFAQQFGGSLSLRAEYLSVDNSLVDTTVDGDLRMAPGENLVLEQNLFGQNQGWKYSSLILFKYNRDLLSLIEEDYLGEENSEFKNTSLEDIDNMLERFSLGLNRDQFFFTLGDRQAQLNPLAFQSKQIRGLYLQDKSEGMGFTVFSGYSEKEQKALLESETGTSLSVTNDLDGNGYLDQAQLSQHRRWVSGAGLDFFFKQHQVGMHFAYGIDQTNDLPVFLAEDLIPEEKNNLAFSHKVASDTYKSSTAFGLSRVQDRYQGDELFSRPARYGVQHRSEFLRNDWTHFISLAAAEDEYAVGGSYYYSAADQWSTGLGSQKKSGTQLLLWSYELISIDLSERYQSEDYTHQLRFQYEEKLGNFPFQIDQLNKIETDRSEYRATLKARGLKWQSFRFTPALGLGYRSDENSADASKVELQFNMKDKRLGGRLMYGLQNQWSLRSLDDGGAEQYYFGGAFVNHQFQKPLLNIDAGLNFLFNETTDKSEEATIENNALQRSTVHLKLSRGLSSRLQLQGIYRYAWQEEMQDQSLFQKNTFTAHSFGMGLSLLY